VSSVAAVDTNTVDEIADEAAAVTTDDDGSGITDEELAELAMAADPREHLDADAVPLAGSVPASDGPLPGWYMPAVARVVDSPTRRTVSVVVVGAFLLINALGLCATYGVISI
jgi:hypothetical protein